MYRLVFELGTFKDARDREWLTPLLVQLVEALAGVNTAFLERNPRTPSIYESGVRYSDAHETCSSCEDLWWDIPVVLSHGYGDCEDLAAWRLAELWMQGIPARAHVTSALLGQGNTLYHVQVMLPDGQIEDPSRILGMGTEFESDLAPNMMAAGSSQLGYFRRQRRQGKNRRGFSF